MRRSVRLILFTFIENFALTLVLRSAYFYGRETLGFSDIENLLMAMAFGATMAVGALCSHRLSQRLKEKKQLVGILWCQFILYMGMFFGAGLAATLMVGLAGLGFLCGLKWPVVESYLGAGQEAPATAKAIGRFSISGATAILLAMLVAGPIIAAWSAGLFLTAAVIAPVSLYLVAPLPRRPAHLPDDHPTRPPAGQVLRYRALMNSSRWLMLGNQAMTAILVALVPHVLHNLGRHVSEATALSGVLDAAKLAAFILMGAWGAWHGRSGLLLAAMAAAMAGFFMVLFGPNLAVVLAGEALFGLAVGVTYYAALYYAIVVKNASVDAGGGHEALIGAAGAIGPAAGLAGIALADVLGSRVLATVAGVGPMLAFFAWRGSWPLVRDRLRSRGKITTADKPK
ncbi:MAG: hypothetical protein SVT52_08110 [Planctomycetota bacterium]|nr:hypothetical protein [Planctomycetota bacterium]